MDERHARGLRACVGLKERHVNQAILTIAIAAATHCAGLV